ncbi:MAG: hypothetical protein QFB86_00585 [Patescibacteria group bacterium]|nr:hypothetical protein [Patescibacteria group bacterium]
MILVGLSGAIGSGKTTFAEFLAAMQEKHVHWESWELIAEIGNALLVEQLNKDFSGDYTELNKWLEPLPDLVLQVTHQPLPKTKGLVTTQAVTANPDQFAKLFEFTQTLARDHSLQQGAITLDSKEQYRSLLQWLGGYLAKNVSGDIWYGEITRRIATTRAIELATVGGVRFPADAAALRAAGGHILTIERPNIVVRDANEITERESKLIEPDAIISNDGSLHELIGVAQTVYSDLKNNALKSRYSSQRNKL